MKGKCFHNRKTTRRLPYIYETFQVKFLHSFDKCWSSLLHITSLVISDCSSTLAEQKPGPIMGDLRQRASSIGKTQQTAYAVVKADVPLELKTY